MQLEPSVELRLAIELVEGKKGSDRADRIAGSPPLEGTGDLGMSTVRQWFSGIVLTIGSVAAVPQIVAQQAALDSGTPSLEARVEQLDQQLRVLQRLRELAADSAAAARGGQAATNQAFWHALCLFTRSVR